MLFIGNLLTDYYHSFIHSYSPFLTLLTLPLRSRRADFVLFVFLSVPDAGFLKAVLIALLNRQDLVSKGISGDVRICKAGPKTEEKNLQPCG